MLNTILSNEYTYLIFLMALTAVPVGFVAGLFGIGGGLITVPFLYYIFNTAGINPDYIMHLAVGTSFAIIIPTSTVSVMTHHKFKAVDFDIVKSYGIYVVLGVIFGTIFAASLKTKSLVLFFSIVILLLGIYLLLLKEKETNITLEIKLHLKIILGFLAGFISAPMGIGGAVMNVPILKFFGYSINKAIGSAAAIGFLIALFGATGFLISGSYLDTNIPLSIGFLNIPAFLIFIPITTFMARIGARTVHKIDKKKISKYFGIFLLVIASKFLYEYLKL
ncbi:MAG: sulfite exporter TauE/SafE family protein [Pelagibacteraceae bacterium]